MDFSILSVPSDSEVVLANLQNPQAVVTLRRRDSVAYVQTSRLVSQTSYDGYENAAAAGLVLTSNYDNVALDEDLVYTDVNVSDSEMSFVESAAASINCELSVDYGVISYQWYKDGRIIIGATSSSISTTSFLPAHVGEYKCVVISTIASEDREDYTSRDFTVTITPEPLTALTTIGL